MRESLKGTDKEKRCEGIGTVELAAEAVIEAATFQYEKSIRRTLGYEPRQTCI